MYKHILVPTDGSTLSLKAARAAGKLASQLEARVTALYVISPYMPPANAEGMAFRMQYAIHDYEKDMRKVADKALAKVAAVVGGKCASATVFDENPWQAIIRAAATKKCDLIVMASHGRRGLAALLLGSETQKVLTHSKTPVLVCR